MYYTKLFSSLTESTVWVGTSAETKVVWITMLAKSDQYGRVQASIPGLARLADVSIEDCEQALDCFLSPDPYSRSTAHEGRRIEVIDGGWRLLNYQEKRRIQDEEHAREKNRERQQRHRDKKRNASRNGCNVTVTQNNPIAETETEIEDLIPNADALGAGSKLPPCPHQRIIDIYHEVLPMLPRVKIWNASRQAHLRARWKNNHDLEGWRDFFEYVGESRFLTGQSSAQGDRKPFFADLEWIVKQSNFTKIIEGKYHD